MTTERAKWWRSFLPKRRSEGSKDASTHNFDPDFDPFAPKAEKPKEPSSAASKTLGDQSQSQQESNKGSSLLSDETYDDSRLDTLFNEQTCRRNMKVSRSGRWKEKRKVRSTLPIQEKETDNGKEGKEDVRRC